MASRVRRYSPRDLRMPSHSSFSSLVSISGSICCCSAEELRVEVAASSVKKPARLASALLAMAVVRVTPVWILRAQSLIRRSLISERCVTISTDSLMLAKLTSPTTHMRMIMASKTEKPPARRVPSFIFFILPPASSQALGCGFRQLPGAGRMPSPLQARRPQAPG
ncbi:hypothetical protein G6F64_014225 [Rhizopus arrhizus]|uniref:Uncharacterized protein n=1 Tax=Rhizopus oryzae TaxID=64495 RepID=A0A9P7BJJ4_RHIOR|nr:hypothetical protein G6F64_014225 [Rhizopus arrhizus]